MTNPDPDLLQIQHVMARFDGTLLQFRCDEKGFVGVCSFGLRNQRRQEDRSDRGIAAALEVVRLVQETSNDSSSKKPSGGLNETPQMDSSELPQKHIVCVGVTTGDLLCTCVGAQSMRLDYTVFGDAINLSARLSQVCLG